MRFHLNYSVQKPGFSIDHATKLFLTGSCFSENIGQLLADHKFKSLINPNGILFNPLSIYYSLQHALNLKDIDENLFLQRHNLFYSYLHHSSINSTSKANLAQKINAINKGVHHFIASADAVIITFGTAFYYYHLNLKTTVANCHKQPAGTFEKCLLTTENIFKKYSDLINALTTINPRINIIFTVSPVKYLKDGVVENNLSKATLLLSVHELVKQFSNCYYFPAYELVNDDLRDYRFYKEDLAHPNEQAINYVWDKFSETFFNDSTKQVNKLITDLHKASSHRSLNQDAGALAKLQEYIKSKEAEITSLLEKKSV